jgi:hypothetical protein
MGFTVLTCSIIIKACILLPVMEQKTFIARWLVVCCFLKKDSIVHRLGTKVSQCPPAKAIQEAIEFQDFIRPMLLGPEHADLWLILNMDQTPVYFSIYPTRMLEVLGNKTIVIWTTINDTKRATVVHTITAAGDQLVPMVVYKGTENGSIKERKLTLRMILLASKHRDNSLASPGIVPLILLDLYQCYIMALVVNEIQDLGC